MRPRRIVVVLALMVCLVAMVTAQQSNRALQAYQDRFRDATPDIKLQILQTADALSVAELGPLYEQALQYGLSNADQLDSDATLQSIVMLAVGKVGEGEYEPAVGSLWSLFEEFADNTARIAVLDVLGTIGPGNAQLVVDLNAWVQAQVNVYRGGVVPDLQVLNAAVVTLGDLGDPSSFPVLLDVQLAQIADRITASARASMKGLETDYVEAAIATTNRRTISNRRPALEFFLDDPDLSDQERARLATGVLAEAVRTTTRDLAENRDLRELRFRATQELVEVPYEPAADALIRHFNLTFQSYDHGIITKTWVLEAIAALGNTGSAAAAARLTQFLDLLNT